MVKKTITILGAIFIVVVGLFVIWELIIPFIGYIFSWFTGVL